MPDQTALLLDRLRECELLEQATLDELGQLPEAKDPDPRALGKVLFTRKLLTKWQINLLAQGKVKELRLGKYVLLDKLGEGGMGQVFKARDRRMGRTVALKVIKKDRLANEDSVKRFYQEVQAAAQLNHPNIATAFDADEAGGTHYFAMEFLDGTDLARLVKESGRLDAAQACEYARQAALGLQHAHDKGLVHRDIKPHNLMLTTGPGGKPVVKLLDMGLARLSQQGETGLTRSGQVLGTPDYLAPEQAFDSRKADARSDVYSLGCTLYFLLTGSAPFTGDTLAQVLLKHQMEQALPLAQRRPDLPPALSAVVAKMMAKDPDDRYQTATEVADALEPFSKGEAGVAPVPPVPARPSKFEATDAWGDLESDDGGVIKTARSVTRADDESPRRREASDEEAGPNKMLLIGAAVGLPVVALLVIGMVFLMWPTGKPSGGPGKVAGVKDREGGKEEKKGEKKVEPPPPVTLPPVVPDKVGELQRFDSAPAAVAFSPDGRTAAYSTPQHNIVLWDLEKKQESSQLAGHTNWVRGFAFSGDGRQLLSASDDGTVRLWDLKTGAELKQYAGHVHGAKAVAWRADGKTFTSFAQEGWAFVWNAATGEQLQRTRVTAGVHGAGLSASGTRLLLGGDDTAEYLWDVDGQKLKTVFRKPARSHSYAIAFSPDGRGALAAGYDSVIRLLDADGTEVLKELKGNEAHVYRLAMSADGKRIASGASDGTVRLFDVAGGREVACFESHKKAVQGLSLSPNGRFLLSAGEDGAAVLLGLPEPGGEALAGLRPGRQPKVVTTPDGERRYEAHSGTVYAVSFSPDGKRIASGGTDKTVRVWDRETGKVLHTLTGHTDDVYAATFSPDGKRLATGSNDKSVRLWDLEAGKQVSTFVGHTGLVKSVVFSPDGRRLLSASDDFTVRLWDVRTALPLRKFDHTTWARRAEFSPDGRYVVTSCSDGNVRVWSLATGKLYRQLAAAGDVYSCAFVPDGRRVAASSFDGHVRVWDVAGGKLLHDLTGHDGKVGAVTASPDGRHLLTSGHDSTVRLWDLKFGREVRQYKHLAYHSLAISPDARDALSGGADGVVRAWSLKLEGAAPLPPAPPTEPDAEARKSEQEAMRERYKAEFALKGVSARGALAKRLLEDSREKPDDLARRYVLLREAHNQYSRGGDLAMGLQVGEDLAFLFGRDVLADRLAAAQAAKAVAEPAALLKFAFNLVQDAVTADRYDVASSALALCRAAAAAAKDAGVLASLKDVEGRLVTYRQGHDAVKAEIDRLAADPADTAAALAVGKFQAFHKENWAEGLPLLAAGSDADLAALARKDLAGPAEPSAVAEVGNGWWDVSEKEAAGALRTNVRRRGRSMLYRALPDLAPLDRAKVADRLKVTFGKTAYRPGLVMEMFADEALKKRVKTRLDYRVEHNWGPGSPDPAVPVDGFSVRWQGWLIVPRKGNYTLYIQVDEGGRLYVDGKSVIDAVGKPGKHSITLPLGTRPHNLRIEHHEATGLAMAVFGWSGPGGDVAVPADWLFHDEKQEALLAK